MIVSHELTHTFAALGDPTRFAILSKLATDGDMTVQEIAKPFAMSLPAVSQHLKVLKECGLIRGDVDGPRVCYCIEPRALRRLKALIGSL